MKTIILIVLATVFCSCGTDQGEARRYDYSVINNSGVSIEVIPYSDGLVKIDKKVVLNNAQKINKIDIDYPPYGELRMINVLHPALRVNKIDIIFNGTKKITYEDCSPTNNCSEQPRNIFNGEFQNERTEVYTITAEDLQNATNCGGNCN